MNHPLRENLEIVTVDGAPWILCKPCRHKYCRADQDWRGFAKTCLLPPTQAGGLMAVLNGEYLLRQRYCPSCAVLLETDFVEEKSHG
jgi:hypothetical protein